MTHPAPDPAPVSTRLFFGEQLPSGPEGETAAEAEARVLLDLETGAPVPLDRLAYGWVRLPSREILYYAGPRERVPAHDPVAVSGSVLPDADAVVLPAGVDVETFRKASRDFYADLRPRAELAELRLRASADTLISRLVTPMKFGALAGLLLLSVGAVFSSLAAVSRRKLDAEAPALKAVEAKADTLVALERLEGPGRSVFDALSVVNPHRPEGVGFSRVIFSDNRTLELQGRSSDVSGVNRMKDALLATDLFASVELPQLDASGGRSSFRMRLNFKNWPKIEGSPEVLPTVSAEAAPVAATTTEVAK
jgi:hypothetical protein